MPMLGRPMLLHLIDRLRTIQRLNGIIIATSTDEADGRVAEFAVAAGVGIWRGPLDDVLGRMAQAAAASNASTIVRVTGDSPLLDPRIIEQALDLFSGNSADVVTNVYPRSFPKGQSVEILTRATLDRLAGEAVAPEEREHVTRYAYAHPERFRIVNFAHHPPRPELQLSVDTPEDFALAEAILARSESLAGFAPLSALIALADEIAGGNP